MSCFYQYRALMWRNYILKRKSLCTTCCELLLPVALMCLLVLLRSAIHKQQLDTEIDIYHPYTFMPNTTTSPYLMWYFQTWFRSNYPQYQFAVSPNYTEYIDYLVNVYNFSRDWILPMEDSDAFTSYIKKNTYGKSSDTPYIAAYVEWNNFTSSNFQYTIWLNVTLSSGPLDQVYTAQGVPTTYVKSVAPYANNFAPTYVFMWGGYQDIDVKNISDVLVPYSEGGFLALQLTNDLFIMQKILKITNFEYPSFEIRPFPTPAHTKDIFAASMQQMLGLLLTLVFIWPVTRIIKSLVEEKEKRIKEGMKIMSLKENALWSSWLTTYFIIFLITSILITLVTSFSVFEYSSKFIIFLVFFLFSMSIYAYAFLMSSFFTRATIATIIGGILMLGLLAPQFAVTATTTKGQCLLYSLSPVVAFYFTAYNIFEFESDSIGSKWSNINSEYNNYTVGDGIAMLFIDFILYMFIGIYLTYVLPSTYGVPLKWYFLCSPSYWCPKSESKENDYVAMKENDQNEENPTRFEEVPKDLKVGVSIQRLRKVFPTSPETIAVKNLSLQMYEGQIFALLGHNGAGKTTTINMLTGMYPPTSGDAFIYGESISSQMSSVRKNLGFCPQHDILFDELTVYEHLVFYAKIKGMRSELIENAVRQIIVDVGLEEKINAPSKTLSGGQKRKLSVGIAFLGDNKIVFLDEPTSGMDVFYRRHMWDLLKKMKAGRVIVLTTHFMEEADYLGDRIGIMAHGVVQCCGSSLYLKNLYGVGYTMTVVKNIRQDFSNNNQNDRKEDDDHETNILPIKDGNNNNNNSVPSQPIIDLIYKHVQPPGYHEKKTNTAISSHNKEQLVNVNNEGGELYETTILSEAAGEISFRVPFSAASTFPKLFEDLDNPSVCETLGISNYGISVTTLEEVFLRVGLGDSTNPEERQKDRKSVHEAKLVRSKSMEEKLNLNNDHSPFSQDIAASHDGPSALSLKPQNQKEKLALFSQNSLKPSFKRHMWALIVKRIHNIKRDKRVWCCQLIIPFLILLIGMALMKIGLELASQAPQNLSPQYEYNQPLYVPYYTSQNVTFDFNFINSSRDYASPYRVENSTINTWKNFSDYLLNTRNDNPQSRFGAFYIPYDMSNVILFVNTTARDSIPIYINMFNRQFIRQITNSPEYTIDVTFHPFPLTSSQEGEYDSVAGMWLSLALGFIPPTMAWFIVNERMINIKHLQVVSGVNLISYWLSNWIFDFINFFTTSMLAIIVIEIYSVTGLIGSNLPATMVLIAAFTYSAPPYVYCLSFFFKNPTSAQNFMLLLFFVSGGILAIVVAVLTVYTSTYPSNLNYLWRLLPNYAFVEAINNLLYRYSGAFGWQNDSIWAWDITGCDLVYMVSTGTGYFILTIIIQYAIHTPQLLTCLYKFQDIPESNDVNTDKDVQDEMRRVQQGKSEQEGDIIILKNLRKIYPRQGRNPTKIAVHNLSFGVHNGECFGFLGMNGAGKTTTLKILSGDVIPTKGTATMKGFDILESPVEVRNHIGYCPQFDAQLPLLTAREHLFLFARIKGIPEQHIPSFVSKLIEQIGLTQYADLPSGGYSGGNKRKLSVGMALIGNPSILFLDEPSTGIDPSSRRFMWNLIASTMAGRSVILTTHSMEEAEALCSRIGIMVNGALSCIGSATHLRSRFGQGYQIDINLGFGKNKQGAEIQIDLLNATQKLHEWIEQSFNEYELLEQQNTHFKYRVGKSLSLGKVFNEVEKNKQRLSIKEYSVAETSLEQIFLYFARKQVSDDAFIEKRQISAENGQNKTVLTAHKSSSHYVKIDEN